MNNIGPIVRRICIVIWAAIPITCLSFYLYDPAAFTSENIARVLIQFEREILILYVAVSFARGFSLLPSTPLVLAGTLIFPERPILVLAVSMAGIVFSSAMIYFFSELLGFSEFFEKHKPESTHRIRQNLEKPWGFFFVMLWAFVPFAPTDAVCYVAGTTKMKFGRFIAAIFLGEIVLCSFYIFSGRFALLHIL